jgi:hypothetical protein
MKNDKNSSAIERLANLKKEQEAAKAAVPKDTELVSQLTHENDGKPDFSELAQKLQERQEKEAKGENQDHVKMTMYIRKDIYDAFNALITKRGQQKEFTSQALSDFIQKKARELGL